jgi:transposase-like protein
MAKKPKGRKAPTEIAAGTETPEQELARLRREVERQRKRIETLEMDREILKKAAAFFAKESE